jgi:5-methylcytosine-specific restriction endonuclease McrA
MSKSSEAVKRWRKNTKRRIVESMGGCCVICGYDEHDEALELHHINPNEKEFGLGAIRGSPKAWTTIVKELRKCVLLCSNCHAVVEAGKLQLPDNPTRFDESYVEYKNIPK